MEISAREYAALAEVTLAAEELLDQVKGSPLFRWERSLLAALQNLAKVRQEEIIPCQ